MIITTVGIDLATSVFQVHGVGERCSLLRFMFRVHCSYLGLLACDVVVEDSSPSGIMTPLNKACTGQT